MVAKLGVKPTFSAPLAPFVEQHAFPWWSSWRYNPHFTPPPLVKQQAFPWWPNWEKLRFSPHCTMYLRRSHPLQITPRAPSRLWHSDVGPWAFLPNLFWTSGCAVPVYMCATLLMNWLPIFWVGTNTQSISFFRNLHRLSCFEEIQFMASGLGRFCKISYSVRSKWAHIKLHPDNSCRAGICGPPFDFVRGTVFTVSPGPLLAPILK